MVTIAPMQLVYICRRQNIYGPVWGYCFIPAVVAKTREQNRTKYNPHAFFMPDC